MGNWVGYGNITEKSVKINISDHGKRKLKIFHTDAIMINIRNNRLYDILIRKSTGSEIMV